VRYSIEQLYHFNCENCEAWFSIGDFPKLQEKFPLIAKDKLNCPVCGKREAIKEKKE